jgi:hypothetical protein
MENIILKPIFSSNDIAEDLIFVNCTLGYNGNVNLLFAEKVYDHLKCRKVENYPPGTKPKPEWPEYRIVVNFQIYPETPQNYKLLMLEENKIMELNNKNINYTNGMQVDSDKYCFACHSRGDAFKNKLDKNCQIFDSNGMLLNEIVIGTGVLDIQTNSSHELWVSYNDTGIFLGDDIGEKGLNCFDIDGNILYRYDSKPRIDECNGLNVCSDNEILVNIYSGSVDTWYAFAEIINKKVVKTMEWRQYTHLMPFSGNHVLAERNGDAENVISKFSLLNIENPGNIINTYQFFNEDNEELHCVHAQKDTLFFWKGKKLYKISIDEFI